MIDGSRIMYMMKFNQNPEEPKEGQLAQIQGLPVSIHQQLLHAEIEYHANNFQHCLKILAEIMAKVDSLGKYKSLIKNIVDHNVALVLMNHKQAAPAKLMINRTLNYLA